LAALPLLGLIGVTIYKMIRKLVNMQCCKRFLQSYQQLRNNDSVEDYDQDLALFASASREDDDPEFQECTVSVKEQRYEEK
jgi:hypothetical protein